VTHTPPTLGTGKRRLRHVALIMDGNGRWATAHGLPRSAGHREGTRRVRPLAEACIDYGIEVMTVFAFSTENWERPYDEVDVLMGLIPEGIEAEREAIMQRRVRIQVLGSLQPLPLPLRVAVQQLVRRTATHDALTLNIAFNYGGRAEIVRAVQQLMRDGVKPDDVTEDVFRAYLYTRDLPDPDLVIRTAGEQRLSNFLIWQAAYAEYYFTPTLWPDFTREDFDRAVAHFHQRTRTFGRLPALASDAPDKA